ncbi:MAG: PAS domain S-box protein, partial [Gammaproteobacteria bacterium]
ELLGRDWVETCIPMGMRLLVGNKLNAVLSGDLAPEENVILTKSGQERLFEWRNTLLRNDAGEVIGTFSSGADITERKRAEEASLHAAKLSAAAEAEFRKLFAGNPLPMWIYNLTTLRFREVNDAAVRGYGYTRAEFLSMTVKDLRPSDQPASPRHRLKSGLVIDVEITSHSITYLGESAVLVVAQDVTERKRAETVILDFAELAALGAAIGLSLTTAESLATALQQSAEAMVTHLGAALARIWTLDETTGLLTLAATGGLPVPADGDPASVPRQDSVLGNMARDGRPLTTNTLVGDPEGWNQDWIERESITAFAGFPLMVNKRVVGLLAVYARRPLSPAVCTKLGSVADHLALGIERHRGDEALRATEERMRFALDAAGVGIWDSDYGKGSVVWSGTIESQYGLRPGEFGGTFGHFVQLIHPDDREAVLSAVGQAEKAGSDFTLEHRALWPDGTARWLRGMGRVQLDGRGNPRRAVGISMDVTERRALEAQYQQAQKMEAIGQLAGGIAHDFNNLLTGILGYCELLLLDLAAGDERRGDIEEIQKAGLSAASLTRQLLTFSRKQIIEPTRLDLNVVVDGMRTMLERLIGEDVKIVIRLGSALDPIRSDRGQIEQIVMNLAVNARDAMPGGGTLTIETSNTELDADYQPTHLGVAAGHYVVLTMTDSGLGMTEEVQRRLFEPFFTTKAVGKGTGLGLATVHGIVKQSGGSINVYSEIGRGTSFKVYMPRDEGPEERPTKAPSAPTVPFHATQAVLVVEDADGLRELTRRVLERQGYTVHVAGTPAEAIDVFDRHPAIEVLLTDVVMPGTSGPDLARQLLERRPGFKVVYMSGYTEDAIVKHGVLEPGISFLHKPFTSETLGRKIREVLERTEAS